MDIFNEYIYVSILMAAICGTEFVVVFDVIYVDTTKHVKMNLGLFIELDDGKIYRKSLYLMVKTMVSCRFSLKPIH